MAHVRANGDSMLRLASLVLILSLCACRGGRSDAPDLIPVTGTILKGGKPAGHFNVTFYPASTGAPSYATTTAEGKFELVYNDGRKGAVPGTHRVVVSSPAPPSQSPEDPLPQTVTTAPPVVEKSFEASVSREKTSFEFSMD